MLPQNWPIAIIDLKDCFFAIPLHSRDAPRFAFSVPSVNQQQPTRRYHWTVLPQGMLNSPTICQLTVANALQPVRNANPHVIIYHYMDDILLAAEKDKDLQTVICQVHLAVQGAGLQIAEEKVQCEPPWKYLGWKITTHTIQPQALKLALQIKTLNDLQKLLGTINWLRPFLGITTQDLHPLFQLLKGDPDLNSKRQLTSTGLQCLQQVIEALKTHQSHRLCLTLPVYLVIIQNTFQPYALLSQWDSTKEDPLMIIEWLFLPHAFTKTTTSRLEMFANLIQKGRH
ncbi:endogenous retrovirus group k member 18 pol [Limosa lapponica baueri]|uniref:ribonuclease H n=1 Tax=Limosa lapponica baueri TaxID=1758121 RepID=A0A2I0U417_LIMLA|nr:endogenous retrovirus group k member 18 pol [Limosa lapponica baueri]